MRRSSLLVVVAFLAAACGSSHQGDPVDGSISFDAPVSDARDAGPEADVSLVIPTAECGNGELEVGEECDDANTTAGDRCSATCDREPYCGDGTADLGERCDDGNYVSGDGCRSDCASDETCGNGELDAHVGEICDDGTNVGGDGCEGNCDVVLGCGDSNETPPEECDDGNTASWDLCGADCRDEHSLVVNSLALGATDEGCDYSGDGEPDNAFAEILDPIDSMLQLAGQGTISGQLGAGIAVGSQIMLLGLLGLDDRSGQDDPSFRQVMMSGAAEQGATVETFFTGEGRFYGAASAFDENGLAVGSIQSSAVGGDWAGGPEDMTFSVSLGGAADLYLSQGYISGAVEPDVSGELATLTDGKICGAIGLANLPAVPLEILAFLGTTPCDDSGELPTMADYLVGGFTVEMLPVPIGGLPPDVDVDGDGLEAFILDEDGDTGCQPVIVACVDGDETVIPGRSCVADERIQDGFSAAFVFEAVRARIIGLQ